VIINFTKGNLVEKLVLYSFEVIIRKEIKEKNRLYKDKKTQRITLFMACRHNGDFGTPFFRGQAVF